MIRHFIVLLAITCATHGEEKTAETAPVTPPEETEKVEKTKEPEFIPMHISGVSRELTTGSPVVVLSTKDEETFLLIFVGPVEAAAIVRERAQVKTPRPMTHDLLKSIILGTGGKVDSVTVTKIEDEIFYAEIKITTNDKTVKIDARPSDSMALAVRVKAPIFVANKVLKEAGCSQKSLQIPEEDKPKREIPRDTI